ncbi:MAG: DegT/DnrJ/EryC1/StrS family aminotransferase [Bacteroidetes bacterium]|nr:DegT/DnrJ/EryC1/StrS family aminotransferase [Bacteroidota bacterium]MBT5990206.1 DegT/DnrJ/EryC1/StrS family aminotransferase [Bacteroidota bacterium]MBT6835471.1 DegT/DnrJ/EryC1/StrS family aminotransferase [Bacteroidota bacterium]
MQKIQMVDLQSQYQKIKTEVDKEIQKVMSEASFINGTAVNEFQTNLENYLGVKHVIPCANGTDALQIAMMALDLQPGDEVITSPFTFIATAEVIALLKLKPVFVDVEWDTFNLDVSKIEAAITNKTKAIVPVHLFGQCVNMETLMQIANKHRLSVIEDNAQAIGSDYTFTDGSKKKAGTIGHIGCTSFFPSKNLGGYGDGGAIFTNDDIIAEQIRVIVNHGMKVRYYHDVIGVNSRLDSIQAAILKTKLDHLDQYIQERQKAAAFYNNAFSNHPNIETPLTSDFTTHVFHQYTLKTKDINRDDLHKYLLDKGIPNAIYYPVPLHLQKAFDGYGFKKGDYPVSEALCESVISLPMHTELDEEQLGYICDGVAFFNITHPKPLSNI